MKIIKNLVICFLTVIALNSCADDEVSYAFNEVSAPTNVAASFNISNDDTGTVTLTPTAEGVTAFQVYFGDVEEETPTDAAPGQEVSHIYEEGEYVLRVVALSASGLTSEFNRNVSISFTPPSNLSADIIVVNNYEVSVTPTADDATVFDVYFGEALEEEATTIMAGEVATYTYAAAGDYTIRVIAKGASATTIEYEDTVSISDPVSATSEDFIGTWVLASEAGSFGVGPAIGDVSWFSLDAQGIEDRACFIDDEYVFGSGGTFSTILGSETWIEAWQGGTDACGTPVAPHDGSASATYSYDDASSSITITGTGAYIALAKGTNNGELSAPADAPNSITYTVSLSDDKNTMNVYLETTEGVFWQFKLVKKVVSPIIGTWRIASESGSYGVGPAIGDVSWFSLDDQGIIDRACLIDDEYIFGSDDSYSVNLGTETWIEGWQGGSDSCGASVAPHDGTASATYAYDESAGTITINGIGAYIALAKGTNTGELAAPEDAPSSIVYNATFIDNNTMSVVIETGTGSGVFWQFKLVKD
ncbi:hypothetical protein H0I23_10210 [Cellulophaga sp. HaHaR_3_176]|uniref:hypothetical protein n=1 Tax=Cellulophaga sp. HaHaR_3_176 TaxID=1942464 RepID=UPI001C1FDDC8|nr:hypothetical protein [Cellulophaga sp. HaHaR_3_176]QWX82836.1 hypothetical protein H0I23_10210 [Cellulophaga sp. HaHaR_3_176]